MAMVPDGSPAPVVRPVAPHHLDTVVDDGVRIGLQAREGVEHPVDLEVVDRIARE
jgi:hypothetical protein